MKLVFYLYLCSDDCSRVRPSQAEGTRVVLAGLQPRSDAVPVDGVGAAQRVALLRIHVLLANRAQPAGFDCGGSGSLCGLGHGAGPLVLCQPEPHLHHHLLHGHAGQRAARVLHLLEQRRQLGLGAFWEATAEPLQQLVEFVLLPGGCDGSGRRRGRSQGVAELRRRRRRNAGRGRGPDWRSGEGRGRRGLRGKVGLVVVRRTMRGQVEVRRRRRVVEGMEGLLVEVRVPRWREGPVLYGQRQRRRRGSEHWGRQRLHHLLEFQISLRRETCIKIKLNRPLELLELRKVNAVNLLCEVLLIFFFF